MKNIEDTYHRLGVKGKATVHFHHDGERFREMVIEDFVARIKF